MASFPVSAEMIMDAKSYIQYASAVALILSSIVLAFLSNLMHGDVPTGTLMYIAQAFLLAGSIFGLDAYVRGIMKAKQN